MTYEHASVEIDGGKLRRLRKDAGLNVVQLAEKLGISFSYLAAIERGDRPTVPPARYITICDALGIEDRTTLHKMRVAA